MTLSAKRQRVECWLYIRRFYDEFVLNRDMDAFFGTLYSIKMCFKK